MKRCRVPFELRTYELDFRGRLPLPVMCRHLQEAAERHAVLLDADVESLLKRHLTWLLLKVYLEVDHYPAGRRNLVVETWPSGAERIYAFREFLFFEEGCDTPYARGSSDWAVLSLDRNRPVRVLDALPHVNFSPTERMAAAPEGDIRPDGASLLERDFPVRLADLDINGHVNNLHYLEWLAECAPGAMWRTHEIVRLQVEFRQQARFGDTIRALTYQDPAAAGPDTTFVHLLRPAGTSDDLIRARSTRRPADGA